MPAPKLPSIRSFRLRHPIRTGEQVSLPVLTVGHHAMAAFYPLIANHPPGYALKVALVHRAGLVIAWVWGPEASGGASAIPSDVVHHNVDNFVAGDLFFAGLPHPRIAPFYGRVVAGPRDGDGEELVVERLAADVYRRQAESVCPYHRVDLPRPLPPVRPVSRSGAAMARVGGRRGRSAAKVDFSAHSDAELMAEVAARGLVHLCSRGGR